MSAVVIGDKVQVGVNTFSDVYMFSHRMADVQSTFVQLATATHVLTVTLDHYVHVNGSLRVARLVEAGDLLTLEDGSMTPVTEVR